VKFIALILSVIVLVLTATPCCAFDGSERHLHQTVQTEKHASGEQDDDCCKDCSPFYVCGTCIGFTVARQQVITFAIQPKRVQHVTVYIPVRLPSVPITIWQPPKL